MTRGRTPLGDRLFAAIPIAILGAGFVALFLGYDWFYWVWVFGFAVFLPLVAVLRGETDADADGEAGPRTRARRGREDEVDDALATLRERYARGELTDEQFERSLEALLETETREDARESLARWRSADESRDETGVERER